MEQIKWIRRLIPEEREQMRLKPLGKVKLVAERIWYNGDPVYIVEHVEAATKDVLPLSYLSGLPYCYLKHGVLVLRYYEEDLGIPTIVHIEPGAVYSKNEYEKYLYHIEQAVERLAFIRRNNVRIFKQGWNGTHTTEI